MTLDSENLTAVVELANIPSQILFNNGAIVPVGSPAYTEYYWRLYVDADGNVRTGCYGFEYLVGCQSLVYAGEEQRYGELVNETQHIVWKCAPSGDGFYLSDEEVVYAEVDYEADTLTMTVPRSMLGGISHTSRFRFETYAYDGVNAETDVTDIFGIPSATAG